MPGERTPFEAKLDLHADYTLKLGRQRVVLLADVFNLLDAQANDIAYWYQYGICNTFSTAGQCPGGQVTQYNATTFHPIQPRMVRAGITINF